MVASLPFTPAELRIAPFDRAIAVLSPRLSPVPDSIGSLAEMAVNFDKANGTMDAIALKLDQAIALHNAGRRGEAVRIYSELISTGHSLPELHHLLGVALLQEGQAGAAVGSLRQAASDEPNSALYQSNLGAAYRELGKLDEAESCFRKAVELSPEFAGAHFNLAMLLEKLGREEEALARYRRALISDPTFSPAYGNLGTLLGRMNRPEEGVKALEKGVALSPRSAELRFNLGNGFIDTGNLTEGIRELRAAAELAPQVPRIWNNLGSALVRAGELEKGEEALRRALALDPDFDAARGNLADVLQRRGNLDDAIEELRRILTRQPTWQEVRQLRAQMLLGAERVDEAILELRQLTTVDPHRAAVQALLARAYQSCGKCNEAIAAARAAARLQESNSQHWTMLGNLLLGAQEFGEARQCYQRVLTLAPLDEIAWYNLGNLDKEESRLREAEECYRRAIELNPSFRQAYINLGVVLDRQGRLEESLVAHERAVEIGPNDPEARFHRALALLAAGNLDQGWKEYEWRRPYEGMPELPANREWNGQPLANKSLYILAEQGIGDEIMFASCLSDVARQARRCVVECDPRLVPLLQRSMPQIEFRKRSEKPSLSAGMPQAGKSPTGSTGGNAQPSAAPRRENHEQREDLNTSLAEFDYVTHLGSLPGGLGRNEQTFPHTSQFLVADLAASREWKSRLQELGDGLKVGISWRGGKDARARRQRSLELSRWSPILQTPGITFLNLQYGDSTSELYELEKSHSAKIHRFPDVNPLVDLDGFAALVANLDLVISIDNSTVHLGGALGVPTWVMLPLAANWRWLRNRADSPWYPQMRLFRQPAPDAWDEVVQHVAHELRSWVENSKSCSDSSLVRRVDACAAVAALPTGTPQRPHISFVAGTTRDSTHVSSLVGTDTTGHYATEARLTTSHVATVPFGKTQCAPTSELMRKLPDVEDRLATREQEKYEFIWKHDAYRQTSFGLLDADKVGLIHQLRQFGVKTVLDAGCGSGKLMRKLITECPGEFEVHGFDISHNCLDPFFDDIKEQILTVGCLWDPNDFQIAYDGVICTDVLEHIPTDKIPAVLENLSRCTRKFCYLAIALFPDRFGPELIGAPLHLTVKEPEWWSEAISQAGFRMIWHGVEKHRSGQNMWLHAFLVPKREWTSRDGVPLHRELC